MSSNGRSVRELLATKERRLEAIRHLKKAQTAYDEAAAARDVMIIQAVAAGCTISDVAVVTGRARSTIRKYIKDFQAHPHN